MSDLTTPAQPTPPYGAAPALSDEPPELSDQQPGAELDGPPVAVPQAAGTSPKKGKKRRAKRRVAKGLLWFALIVTGLFTLAEPWLLVPIAATVVAISLWD